MKPIRILIIDDQFARDDLPRLNLISTTGINESGTTPPTGSGIEAVFCSGQSVDANTVTNDYEVVTAAVMMGWGKDTKWQWNLVLLDVRFDSGVMDEAGIPKGGPNDDAFGSKVREWLRRDFPDLPVVMFSSKGQEEIEDHSEHYLSKDGINEREFKRVLLDYGHLSLEQARHLLGLGCEIIFVSREMLKVYRDGFLQAASNNPILILGESGSGKEMLARYIHRTSSRKDASFVALNMSAIPESLAEAELFGYEKGAFTGATKEGKKGHFELANKGTLFLDEIGDMNLLLQPKVLRAIQEGAVRRIGSDKDTQVDVRLISATHRKIEERVAANTFREDLFHRINRVTIAIPPLRERRADILPLAQALLEKAMAHDGKKGISFSTAAKKKLEGYDFPGNVRELENLIAKLVVETGNHRVLSGEDIELRTPKGNEEVAEEKMPQPPIKPTVTLANLHEFISTVPIDKDDPALLGVKPRLESAIQDLMQRCAGAALAQCKKPMEEEYGLLLAMQLMAGSKDLKGALMYRELDKILGRPQKTALVNQDDLKALVEIWMSSRRG